MDLNESLNRLADAERAKNLQRFFKTGKGEYGEGDIFLGIVVPELRNLCKECEDASFEDIDTLISSPIHEARMLSLLLMVEKFRIAEKNKDENEKDSIFNAYLDYASQNKINNWDLVDLSAPRIIGRYLLDKDKSILYELLRRSLWEKRIAILSTFAFIKEGGFEDSLRIARILLKDKHDLIQKAVGWMLREIGKKDEKVLKDFLDERYKDMPRTMLRYSIERLSEKDKKRYLKKV